MRTLLASLIARWVLSFAGAALLAALAWIFGPLLWPLEGAAARLAVILAIMAAWAGANLFLDLRRRRRDAELAAGVAAQEPDARASAAAEEATALEEKLTTALALLRKARGTKGYLYEQPWYAIIGPPGAGKTTALLNAGLRFPLAAEMEQGAVAGIGGTRRCDWWFTEDAVLIDTAGRYTTQDSDAEIDHAGWLSFLDLLKRTRPQQPLNGLVVAIALSEIAGAPQGERLAHARAIRRRVKEIEERLAVRLPVYAIFTKADLIAGFTEFFDDLDRDRRAQVWGATFPLTDQASGPVGAFSAEFQALVERLNTRLFERLQSERSPERRALIAGFAPQIASLAGPLGEFVEEAFGGSRLDPAPLLRGFYFTSGTQEGTPIDRLTGVLVRSFGIDQRRAPSLRPVQGRSYFLGRLVKEVIFGEAMLGSERPGAARRRTLIRAGAFAAIALVVLAGGALLWHTSRVDQQRIAVTSAAFARYEKTAAALKLDPVNDADLPRVLPLLDEARALPGGYDSPRPKASSWLPLGLSQKAKLAAGARAVYRHALERVLLPRLIWRLETQMRGNFDRPEFLYEATRVYLMLGGAGPLDRDLVRAWWVSLDWPVSYPGAVMKPVRADLARHLDALLGHRLPAIPLDGALIAEARTTFSRVPLSSRIYSRIAPSAAARAVPPWRPSEALGAAGARIFLRASGKPLDADIPGFYTVRGFHDVLLPALGNVTQEVASESWVLGPRSELAPDSAQARQIEREVIGLYEADYEKRWDALLADLDIAPLRTPQQAVQELYILASPQSPMRTLLAAIARQLTLSRPPSSPAKTAAQGAAQPAAPKVPGQLQPLLAAENAGAAPAPPGRRVDEHYRALRDYVGSGSGAPIDQTLKAIDALRQQLTMLATATAGAAPPAPSGQDPLLLLRAEAAGAPTPVARWLQTMIASATALRSGSVASQVKAAYDGSGGPAALCRQAVAGRYPFSAGADIPLGDFARLFAPGGLLDGFFNTELRPYVDTTGRVWHVHPVDGVPPPISPAALAEFKRAAAIRDMFFGPGGNTPAVSFELTPVSLDSGAKSVTLDLGGTKITYANGTPSATQITWPGANGMGTAQLTFDPTPAGGSGTLQASGPWALFHLFDQGILREDGSADRYLLTFQLGDRQAIFKITAGSVLNPFARGMLRGFRCPSL
jgi:type VI secretion system protein ImpL